MVGGKGHTNPINTIFPFTGDEVHEPAPDALQTKWRKALGLQRGPAGLPTPRVLTHVSVYVWITFVTSSRVVSFCFIYVLNFNT